MKTLEIINKQGTSFIVLYDDEDEKLVKKHTWYINNSGYVCTNITNDFYIDENHTVLLHRKVMNTTDGQFIDHINRNTLDNRKCNLRICTPSENGMNKLPVHGKTSKYKGVSWYKNANKWRVSIGYKHSLIFLGYRKDEAEAAKLYDQKAKELFGEIAVLNFPD